MWSFITKPSSFSSYYPPCFTLLQNFTEISIMACSLTERWQMHKYLKFYCFLPSNESKVQLYKFFFEIWNFFRDKVICRKYDVILSWRISFKYLRIRFRCAFFLTNAIRLSCREQFWIHASLGGIIIWPN